MIEKKKINKWIPEKLKNILGGAGSWYKPNFFLITICGEDKKYESNMSIQEHTLSYRDNDNFINK